MKEYPAAWLIWADGWHPSWRAYIDGQKIPIVPANAASKAILVPSRKHKVRFAFEDTRDSLIENLWVGFSLIMVVVLLAGVLMTAFGAKPAYNKKVPE